MAYMSPSHAPPGFSQKMAAMIAPRPTSEEIIFASAKFSYVVPVFLFKLDLGSAIHSQEHLDSSHKGSHKQIYDFWATRGSQVTIDELMSVEMTDDPMNDMVKKLRAQLLAGEHPHPELYERDVVMSRKGMQLSLCTMLILVMLLLSTGSIWLERKFVGPLRSSSAFLGTVAFASEIESCTSPLLL
eukprot:gnl/MRDRNA2_/MRDRNA2_350720_c0_seq1.p1 gnl/MRDRNA2_/MRDRNA2_350720_c0~~gnl/MRDRNA2_/MRDRNA2_350720_c0_seq1.p1  ORF type:complete len:215 (+),score=28.74 gnl/MRDRNA2_/MRDRNA2_350720_c0_seq1:88-645(+)